jgi:hypothetical protein
MRYHKAKVLIWGTAIALSLLMAVTIGPSLFKVWQCYGLANAAEREVGAVIGKHESVGLVFAFGSQPNANDSCTAKTSKAVFEAAQIGDTFEVVRKPGRPDQCYLTSNLALSGIILAGLLGLTLVFIALVLGFAWFAQRSFAGVPELTAEFAEEESASVSCSGCALPMERGYIVPFGGIHWRDGRPAYRFTDGSGRIAGDGRLAWKATPAGVSLRGLRDRDFQVRTCGPCCSAGWCRELAVVYIVEELDDSRFQ